MMKHTMLAATAGMALTVLMVMPAQSEPRCLLYYGEKVCENDPEPDPCFWFQGTYWCKAVPKPPETCTKSKCKVTLSSATTPPTDLAGCGEGAEIGRLNLNFSSTDSAVDRSDFHSRYQIHRISYSGGPEKFADFEYREKNDGPWRSAVPTGIIAASASSMGDNTVEFRARHGASIQGRVNIRFHLPLIDPHRNMVVKAHDFYFTGGAGCDAG